MTQMKRSLRRMAFASRTSPASVYTVQRPRAEASCPSQKARMRVMTSEMSRRGCSPRKASPME